MRWEAPAFLRVDTKHVQRSSTRSVLKARSARQRPPQHFYKVAELISNRYTELEAWEAGRRLCIKHPEDVNLHSTIHG